MKKLCIALVASALVVAAPAFAHDSPAGESVPASSGSKTKPAVAGKTTAPKPAEHSGGTDANGCHTNHSTGVYHCHNPK